MLKPGQLIDEKYRIVRLVGEGGMGAVYEAEHAFLERLVAIKVLAPGMAESPEAIRRFYQEAKAAAKIGHENICEVTDVGQTQGGMPYIVMQLLHGKSLAAEIAAKGPLRIGRAVDVATQALAALSAAHAAGIVHRDMKPDNLFLTRVAGRDDFVKVLDFGISKVRSAAGSGGIGLTKTGTVLGTPAYMSPEQARGETEVDGRADVWAMGVVTYEMLVGAPPFEGTNYNQVIYNVVCASIPPPRSRRDAVSGDLDAVVMRALERDPAKRFPTADAFSEALEVAWLSVGESGVRAEAGDRGLGLGEEATEVAAYPMPPSAPPEVAVASPGVAARRSGREAAAIRRPFPAAAAGGRSAAADSGRPRTVQATPGPVAGTAGPPALWAESVRGRSAGVGRGDRGRRRAGARAGWTGGGGRRTADGGRSGRSRCCAAGRGCCDPVGNNHDERDGGGGVRDSRCRTGACRSGRDAGGRGRRRPARNGCRPDARRGRDAAVGPGRGRHARRALHGTDRRGRGPSRTRP